METNLQKYKSHLNTLINLGKEMFNDIYDRALEENSREDKQREIGKFGEKYQGWYTESFLIVKQIIPSRLTEFEELYKSNQKRKHLDAESYSIQDWLRGIVSIGKSASHDIGAVIMRFHNQLKILESSKDRLESFLLDIKGIVQADIFDSEIEVSKELFKKGFFRAAGVICGVILEKHLKQVCENHQIIITKKIKGISSYTEVLKSNEVINMPTWRLITALADIRNMCVHNTSKEPTKDEIEDLIKGTEKIIKTVF